MKASPEQLRVQWDNASKGVLDYHPIPEAIHAALERYAVDRIRPGHFLIACLENDLSQAVSQADTFSLLGLRDIMIWIYNVIPSNSWGSPEKVAAWLQGEEDAKEALDSDS